MVAERVLQVEEAIQTKSLRQDGARAGQASLCTQGHILTPVKTKNPNHLKLYGCVGIIIIYSLFLY